MHRRTLLSAALVVAAVLGGVRASTAADEPPALTDETFEKVRDAILPTSAEERWREIPWRTSTWAAIVEAAAADKPVLLWAMNGHPLACT